MSGLSGGGISIPTGSPAGNSLIEAVTTAAQQNLLEAGAVGLQIWKTATTAAAQNALGGGTVGKLLFATATTAAAQNALGGGVVGKALLEAATTAAAQDILGGGTAGRLLFATASTAAAQNMLGGSTVGKAIFEAATTAAAYALLSQPGQFNKLVVSAAISGGSVTIPANTFIQHIIINERAGAAITGGLAFGTSAAGGVDVVAAKAVGANADTHVTDAALLKRFFSVAATQAVTYEAVVAWNGANVNITVVYGQL